MGIVKEAPTRSRSINKKCSYRLSNQYSYTLPAGETPNKINYSRWWFILIETYLPNIGLKILSEIRKIAHILLNLYVRNISIDPTYLIVYDEQGVADDDSLPSYKHFCRLTLTSALAPFKLLGNNRSPGPNANAS